MKVLGIIVIYVNFLRPTLGLSENTKFINTRVKNTFATSAISLQLAKAF